MSQTRGLFWVFFILLFICAGLTWVIYRQLQASPHPSSIQIDANQAPLDLPTLEASEPFSLPPKDEFLEVLDRPLFSRSRRQPEEKEIVVTPVADPELGLALRGVVFSDEEGVALLSPVDGGELVRLRKGDNHGEWTLLEVAPDRVEFGQGEQRVSLKLEFELRRKTAREPQKTRQTTDRRDARRQALERQQQLIEEQLEKLQNQDGDS